MNNDNEPGISRRGFMARATMLASFALAYPSAALTELRRSNQNSSNLKNSTLNWQHEATWQTLFAVQEVLFPAGENIPGASDIGATAYLHNAIDNPKADGADKAFIFRGTGWLNALTQTQHKKEFVQLSFIQQDEIIQQIVQSRAGRNWVSMLLTYTLEALLADPIYGGNKNEVGWKWLQHQPGYPAPSKDKIWDHLQQRRLTMVSQA